MWLNSPGMNLIDLKVYFLSVSLSLAEMML